MIKLSQRLNQVIYITAIDVMDDLEKRRSASLNFRFLLSDVGLVILLVLLLK